MSAKGKERTIVCAGRVYCDMIFTGLDQYPRLGEEVYADNLAVEPGGGAFITAANLGHLGEHAMLLATLPGGPFGTAIYPKLVESKVDLTLAPYNEENGAQVTAAIGFGGDRAFLTKRSGFAVSHDLLKIFENTPAAHLHIGELKTALEQPKLVEIAKAKGMTISLDCAWDQASFNHAGVLALLNEIDIFLPNELEAKTLGLVGKTHPYSSVIVIKSGKNGATIPSSGLSVAPPVVEAVDATGAGDAFNAGFLTAWLDGASLETCLIRGNKCGAAAVQRIGGAPRQTDRFVS